MAAASWAKSQQRSHFLILGKAHLRVRLLLLSPKRIGGAATLESMPETTKTLSRRRFLISTWLPVVVMLLVIVRESTSSFGGDHTGRILRPIWEALFGAVTNKQWDQIHHVLRKTGHFVGYGLQGLTWLRAWLRTWRPYFSWAAWKERWRWALQMALFTTMLVASLDEVHQSFLPNRTGMVSDVLLDTAGAALMLTIAFLGRWIKQKTAKDLRPIAVLSDRSLV
jgi:VanZ family protein